MTWGDDGDEALEPAATGSSEGERPLRADARANRQKILQAASEVFTAEGVGACIDSVARRAGVGVGTVYRNFPTKEDLFEAVVLAHFTSLIDRAEELTRAEDAGAAFEQFVDALADTVIDKRDLADALGAAGIDIKAKAGGKFDELRRLVELLLSRAQDAGAVRRDLDADELFVLVHGTCSAASSAGRDRESTRRLLSVVCQGLRPVPDEARA
ncbi:MAG TPA: TetR/AcrR family transcriptional regulator [Acidimicrobiales bacterium]|nr:TetR/AcrR family transcriptional regulator [Acidimicrobiales bacterium]